MTGRWLGRVPYREAWARQRETREAVAAGAPGELWLLEHDPVITLGRRGGVVDHVLAEAAGYEVVETDRGGLATCHEPGQLVGYLIMDVRGPGIRRVVEALEEGILRWLRAQGVPADRRVGFPGVWVGTQKLCAVGLNVSSGVTNHGFALNLTNPCRGFGLILPCGITDGGVTALAMLLPGAPAPKDAAPQIAEMTLDALRGIR